MRTLLRSVSALTLLLSSCATVDPLYEFNAGMGGYDPLRWVPPEFLSAYPRGSQARTADQLQAAFNAHERDFTNLYKNRQKQNFGIAGKLVMALAIDGTGTVQGISKISSDLGDPAFETAVLMYVVKEIDFGPAAGEGFYVFWYPLVFMAG